MSGKKKETIMKKERGGGRFLQPTQKGRCGWNETKWAGKRRQKDLKRGRKDGTRKTSLEFRTHEAIPVIPKH